MTNLKLSIICFLNVVWQQLCGAIWQTSSIYILVQTLNRWPFGGSMTSCGRELTQLGRSLFACIAKDLHTTGALFEASISIDLGDSAQSLFFWTPRSLAGMSVHHGFGSLLVQRGRSTHLEN